jgi:hypothetical protein
MAFEPKLSKVIYVAQGLENRAVQNMLQVLFTVCAVIEPEMYPLPGNVFGTVNMQDHGLIPTELGRCASISTCVKPFFER